MASPFLKASPLGEAAARRRLMRAKFPAATRKTGNCSKVCPHPALRATFPLGGRLFISNAKMGRPNRLIKPLASA